MWKDLNPSYFTTRVVSPRQLSDVEFKAWKDIQKHVQGLHSPYLTPEWAQLVNEARSDARIVVFYEGQSPIGFLPVQLTTSASGVHAMPLGSPICDYQSVIAKPNTPIGLSKAVTALGVSRIDFTNLLDTHQTCRKRIKCMDNGLVVDTSEGWDGFVENRKRAGSSVVRRVNKKYRKLQADFDRVAFKPFEKNDQAFEQLMNWKRDQWDRTGSVDVLSKAWVKDVISGAYARNDVDFGSEFFSLTINDELAAAMFCLRYKSNLHAWFVGYNHRFQVYSPGLVLFQESIKAIADAGFTSLDLGAGDYRF
jgi:CelD/BcsL family acetyltransferase involved in cellulose biosynthesis